MNASGKFRLVRLCLRGVLVELLSRTKWTIMIASHPYPKVELIEFRSFLSGYEVSGSWALLLACVGSSNKSWCGCKKWKLSCGGAMCSNGISRSLAWVYFLCLMS